MRTNGWNANNERPTQSWFTGAYPVTDVGPFLYPLFTLPTGQRPNKRDRGQPLSVSDEAVRRVGLFGVTPRLQGHSPLDSDWKASSTEPKSNKAPENEDALPIVLTS